MIPDQSRYQNCPHCGKTIIVEIKSGILIKRVDLSKAKADLP